MAQGTSDGQQAEGRREQLLRSALEIIVARGYADTRIADVAEHAGISPALVIYYFKTRDQLLTEALRYSEDAWYAAGTQRLAAIATAVGRLTELIAMTCSLDTDPAARTDGRSGSTCGRCRRATRESRRCAGRFDERWRQTIATTVLALPGRRASSRHRGGRRLVRGYPVGAA